MGVRMRDSWLEMMVDQDRRFTRGNSHLWQIYTSLEVVEIMSKDDVGGCDVNAFLIIYRLLL